MHVSSFTKGMISIHPAFSEKVTVGLEADADVEVNTPVFSKVFPKDLLNVSAKIL